MAIVALTTAASTNRSAAISEQAGADLQRKVEAGKIARELIASVVTNTLDAAPFLVPSESPRLKPLNPQDRPKELQDVIQKSFDELSKSSGPWAYNGDMVYGLCGIGEINSVLNMIKEAPLTQKDFYILDEGAGEFQWGDFVANVLNSMPDLRPDMNIHVVSVRAEAADKSEETTTFQCKRSKPCNVYNIGNFNVENIAAELSKHKLPYENSYDMVISRRCFLHLYDPMGTYVQNVNMVRPITGQLIMDGFCYYEDENTKWDPHGMIPILQDTNAEFLILKKADLPDELILRRRDDKPCQLPMRYMGMVPTDEGLGVSAKLGQAKYLCRIKRFSKPSEPLPNLSCDKETLYGDKRLFAFLQEGGCLAKRMKWAPLKKEESKENN